MSFRPAQHLPSNPPKFVPVRARGPRGAGSPRLTSTPVADATSSVGRIAVLIACPVVRVIVAVFEGEVGAYDEYVRREAVGVPLCRRTVASDAARSRSSEL